MSHSCDYHSTSHLSKRTLILAISINALLTIAQIIGGLAANSLALLTDALHNASDAMALVLALVAIIIGERPADHKRSYGYKRAESIAALINLTTLILLGVYLAIKSINNLIFPEDVHAPIMIWIAVIALAIDTGTALLLRTHAHNSENMRAAFLHNVMDALASLAVILGGVAIFYKGWMWIDPALSLLISLYVIGHGYKAMRKTINLLMQGTPYHLNRQTVKDSMKDVQHVTDVHHLHIWQIHEHQIALEAHIVIDDIQKMEEIKQSLKTMLNDKHKINHSTLEFETIEAAAECKEHEHS